MAGLARCKNMDSSVVHILHGLAETGDDGSTWFL